jgi:hypothetical protein
MPSSKNDEKIMKMVERGVMESPLRSLISLSNGALPLKVIQWILKLANLS